MERNITLDYFKILFSLLVITIHIPYEFSRESLDAWWYIPNGLARMAVPFFFITNGYFFANKMNNLKATKKYMIHLLIIYTTWFIIYLRPFIYQNEELNIIGDLRFDILLETFFWGYFHLWYLPALICGIILLILLNKLIKKDIIIISIVSLLFIAGYILEPHKTSLYSVRNALFMGLPFIAIGYYLRKIELNKIKPLYIIIVFSISLLTLIFESYNAHRALHTRDIYLSLLPLCGTAFLFIMKFSKSIPTKKYHLYLGNLSAAIYFSHVYIIFKTFTVFRDVSSMERLLIVLAVTIPVSIFIIFINKRIKIFL